MSPTRFGVEGPKYGSERSNRANRVTSSVHREGTRGRQRGPTHRTMPGAPSAGSRRPALWWGAPLRLAPLLAAQGDPSPHSDISPKHTPGHDGRAAPGSLCCGGSRRWSSVRSGEGSAHITSRLARPPLVGTGPSCRPAISLQNLCRQRRGCQGRGSAPTRSGPDSGSPLTASRPCPQALPSLGPLGDSFLSV